MTRESMETEEWPAEFWQGVQALNGGEYYACHDILEALWMEAPEPPKSLYQGLLQIAVACYHLGNQNWRGAVILLGEGMRRLANYEPEVAGLDVTRLIAIATVLLEQLQQAGPDEVTAFSEALQHALASGTTQLERAGHPALDLPQLLPVHSS